MTYTRARGPATPYRLVLEDLDRGLGAVRRGVAHGLFQLDWNHFELDDRMPVFFVGLEDLGGGPCAEAVTLACLGVYLSSHHTSHFSHARSEWVNGWQAVVESVSYI